MFEQNNEEKNQLRLRENCPASQKVDQFFYDTFRKRGAIFTFEDYGDVARGVALTLQLRRHR